MEVSVSITQRLHFPGEGARDTHWIGGWVGLRASLLARRLVTIFSELQESYSYIISGRMPRLYMFIYFSFINGSTALCWALDSSLVP
jgi:hypothetical protein